MQLFKTFFLFPAMRVNGFAHVNHTSESPSIGVLLCINGAGIQYSWMKQHVGNACGPIAVTHCVLNCRTPPPIVKDSTFAKFFGESAALSPDERGHLMGAADGLRSASASAAAEVGDVLWSLLFVALPWIGF